MTEGHDPQKGRFYSHLRETHTAEAIQERLGRGPEHSYLRDFVYGAIDGTVTTFAVISGVTGAELPARIIIILGMANLVGDGFSMAVSNFLATRADRHLRDRARRAEELHIQHVPEGEREEVRQIFANKGFGGEDLEKIVAVITSDKKQWIDTMLTEELGIPLDGPSPWRAAFSTFLAFVLVGLLPLGAYFYQIAVPEFTTPFFWSAVVTGAAFFTVGALKGRFLHHRFYWEGLITLLMGGSAAILAYLVGVMLKNIQ